MREPVGSHVDLAPTIAELIGVPAAPDWIGRSLFDDRHPHRAYFYVAEDHFGLAVRGELEVPVYSVRDGRDELSDLDADPLEQHNVAEDHPARCDQFSGSGLPRGPRRTAGSTNASTP